MRPKILVIAAFYLLTFALLLPVWLFPYFPSADGPSHLFNSYVYLRYGHASIFQQAYTLHVPTAGNLAGHGLAILLLQLGLPWEACEKLLVTFCVVGLAAAFHYAVAGIHSAHPAAVFLVAPFLYNWPLQMGFWSFALGVPFLLVCIGLNFRYRGNWNARSLSLLFLAAGAAYVCHPIAWAVCGLVIAVFTVTAQWPELLRATERRRSATQILLPLAVFIPFAIPNLLFASENNFVQWDHIRSIRTLLWPLYTDAPLHLFEADARPARVLFALLLLGSLGNGIWRIGARKIVYADTLLLVAALLLTMGLFCPGRIGEGTFLAVRFFLFGYLVWALWLGATATSRATLALASISVLMTLWLVWARMPAWSAANRALSELVKLGRVVPPNSYVCQLDFLQEAETVHPMDHAIDLLPARNIVDVRDYEAGRHAFWTRFRPGYFLDENYLVLSSQKDFEGALRRFETRTGKKLSFIVLTNLKDSPGRTLQQVLPTLWPEYQEMGASNAGIAIFARKS